MRIKRFGHVIPGTQIFKMGRGIWKIKDGKEKTINEICKTHEYKVLVCESNVLAMWYIRHFEGGARRTMKTVRNVAAMNHRGAALREYATSLWQSRTPLMHYTIKWNQVHQFVIQLLVGKGAYWRHWEVHEATLPTWQPALSCTSGFNTIRGHHL